MYFSAHTLLSIGQFAKLHEINKKTLMWYDEIGLLKPAVIRENGYRYYTYHQSSTLEIILMLRELDVPLRDIQAFLENRSAASLDDLLTENLAKIDRTISHLKSVRKVMAEKKHDLDAIQTLNIDDISVIEKEQRTYLATVDITEKLPFEAEVAKVFAEAKKYQLRRLYDATYGAMLPVEKLYCGQTSDYQFLYIQIPEPQRKNGLHIPPKGKYLRAFFQGPWDKLPERYEEILSYAEAHHLQLYGYAYEKGINELVIDQFDDYITLIEIPIKEEA